MFEEVAGFGEAFALQGEGGPGGDIVHLLADEGGKEFSALIPEEGPDKAEGIDDFVGIDFFALTVGGSFFLWFEFDGRAFGDEEDFGGLLIVEDSRCVLPIVAGEVDKFVQDV